MQRSQLSAVALAFALLAAACGSDEVAPSDTTEADTTEADTTEADTTEADAAMDTEAMDDSDGMAMNMGDVSATRADGVDDATLATGELVLLDSRPEGFDETTGTAWIARHADGTTVTVELAGVIPDADYISHLHADVCANNGGDHYQFEVGGSELPPNEIHLAFTSDADGNGFMTAENQQVAGPDAVAFIVHPVELIENKIGCIDFVPVS